MNHRVEKAFDQEHFPHMPMTDRFLQTTPIFQSFTLEEIARIQPYLNVHYFKEHDLIVNAGDIAHSFMIIVSGVAKGTKRTKIHKGYSFYLNHWDIIGEPTLSSNTHHTVAYTAETDMICIELTEQKFYDLSSEMPNLSLVLLTTIIKIMKKKSIRILFNRLFLKRESEHRLKGF